MNNPTMLYKSPGEHITDGVSYDYVIVDEPDVEAAVAEGWSRSVAEAGQAAQDRLAEQLQANEAEQARIAEELAEADPDANVIDPPAGASGLRAVHKGRGKWAVVNAEGAEVQTGLTKEEAQAAVA